MRLWLVLLAARWPARLPRCRARWRQCIEHLPAEGVSRTLCGLRERPICGELARLGAGSSGITTLPTAKTRATWPPCRISGASGWRRIQRHS
jgi:hypothetical protein